MSFQSYHLSRHNSLPASHPDIGPASLPIPQNQFKRDDWIDDQLMIIITTSHYIHLYGALL
jgi:hypothetical protein